MFVLTIGSADLEYLRSKIQSLSAVGEINDYILTKLGIGNSSQLLYHAGAIDTFINATEDARSQELENRDGALQAALIKAEIPDIRVIAPHYHADKLIASFLRGEHYDPAASYSVCLFRDGSELDLNIFKGLLWDIDQLLFELSPTILVDLHNPKTVGTYVEMIEAADKGKFLLFAMDQCSPILGDPLIKYFLDNAQSSQIFLGEPNETYQNIAATIYKEGNGILQNNIRFDLEVLTEIVKSEVEKQSYIISREPYIIQIQEENGMFIPSAIAYLYILHMQHKNVSAALIDPAQGNTYLRAKEIPRVTLDEFVH